MDILENNNKKSVLQFIGIQILKLFYFKAAVSLSAAGFI